MSLFGSLSIARSGMSATQARAQVTSTNIANVSTPGYVRREMDLVSRPGGPGVEVAGVNRSQNERLLENRREAQGQSARSETLNTVLARSVSAFGQPGGSGGVFGAFDQFTSDLQTLKASPESASSQALTVSSLKGLVSSLSGASTSIQDERTLADAAIATDVERANQLTQQLFDLNADIRSTASASGNANAMLDQRDKILDELSQIIPVEIRYETSGAATVTTSTGLGIVGPTVNKIEFTPGARVGALDTNTSQGGRLSLPTISGYPIAPGSGIHSVTEGRIAANLDLRDTILTQQAADLDQFALDLATAFDTAGEPLLLDGGVAVNALNVTGLAERLSVDPRVDPEQGGLASRLRDGLAAATPGSPSDDTILTRLADAARPFGDKLGTIISSVSTEALRAERIHAGNVAREITLTEAELGVSGVDLDFELQSLLAIEQAYSANARVIQTISDMLDTLTRL